MNEPTHVDLFSGIGGFAIAAKWAGFRTIAFCEIDRYYRQVLAKNFLADAESCTRSQSISECNGSPVGASEGTRDWAGLSYSPRLHSNIFDFDGTAYRGCDLLTGGFPCQPFSVAGKRRGAEDDRAIWPQMFRVISEARPAWVLGENVPGIISMELDNVLSDLEGIGYTTRPFIIPACAVDARHRRDRLWIVGRSNAMGYPKCDRFKGGTEINSGQSIEPGDKAVAHSTERESGGLQQRGIQSDTGNGGNGRAETSWWQPEPPICRVVNGLRNRVDRLKGLGNAIVPQVAYEILREIRNLIT